MYKCLFTADGDVSNQNPDEQWLVLDVSSSDGNTHLHHILAHSCVYESHTLMIQMLDQKYFFAQCH